MATDYNVGRFTIVCAFAWSQAAAARERVVTLAAIHRVGVFEYGLEQQGIWLPTGGGRLEQLGPDPVEVLSHPRAGAAPRVRRPVS